MVGVGAGAGVVVVVGRGVGLEERENEPYLIVMIYLLKQGKPISLIDNDTWPH